MLILIHKSSHAIYSSQPSLPAISIRLIIELNKENHSNDTSIVGRGRLIM